MARDLNELNHYGVPLHACHGYRQDEHYWAWLTWKRESAAVSGGFDPTFICDEPGCLNLVTVGTPAPSGFRFTCHQHAPKVKWKASRPS